MIWKQNHNSKIWFQIMISNRSILNRTQHCKGTLVWCDRLNQIFFSFSAHTILFTQRHAVSLLHHCLQTYCIHCRRGRRPYWLFVVCKALAMLRPRTTSADRHRLWQIGSRRRRNCSQLLHRRMTVHRSGRPAHSEASRWRVPRSTLANHLHKLSHLVPYSIYKHT